MKALVNAGGGVGEREEMRDAFDKVDSPSQIGGAIDTAERLLAGQYTGLETQYKQNTKRSDFQEKMTPEALSIFNKFQKKPFPASVNVGPNTKDDADGTQYHKDGWRWEKRGNQIVPVEQEHGR